MASLTACPGFKSCYDVPHYKKIYTASVSSNIKRKMSKTVPWTCPVELFTGRKFGGRFVCLFVCLFLWCCGWNPRPYVPLGFTHSPSVGLVP
jgi:hypothetical protein